MKLWKTVFFSLSLFLFLFFCVTYMQCRVQSAMVSEDVPFRQHFLHRRTFGNFHTDKRNTIHICNTFAHVWCLQERKNIRNQSSNHFVILHLRGVRRLDGYIFESKRYDIINFVWWTRKLTTRNNNNQTKRIDIIEYWMPNGRWFLCSTHRSTVWPKHEQ